MRDHALLWSALALGASLLAVWQTYGWARRRVQALAIRNVSVWARQGETLATYLAVSAAGHFGWELVQLPLFGIWTSGSLGQLAFATVHCTGGDLVIATTMLLTAQALAWARDWPLERFAIVAASTVALGIAYTGYSEWHNVYVKEAWSYAAAMPTLTIAGHALGLAPLAQWLLVPTLALWALRPADKAPRFFPSAAD